MQKLLWNRCISCASFLIYFPSSLTLHVSPSLPPSLPYQLEQSNNLGTLDVQQILLDMRRQRLGLIQTPDQLRFSYIAILQGAMQLLGFENNVYVPEEEESEEDELEESESEWGWDKWVGECVSECEGIVVWG